MSSPPVFPHPCHGSDRMGNHSNGKLHSSTIAGEFVMTHRRTELTGRTICTGLAILLFSLTTLAASAQVLSSHAPTGMLQPPVTASQPLTKPLLRVNGTVFTERDLQREIATIFPFESQHKGGLPSSMAPEIRQGAAQMMVFEELVYQESLRRHMTITPERLVRGESEFRKQFKSPVEYQQFLQQEFHGDRKLLRTRIVRSLLIDKFLKLEVTSKAVVPAIEAKAYFDKHPEEFRVPESFAFQSISFLPPENATPAQLAEGQKRAQAVLGQAKAAKNYEEFGALAEKNSEDDFRVMMGDHKAADRSKLPPVVVNALAALNPGQVSDVIEFDKRAYTILRLNAHIPAGTQKFENIQPTLRERLAKDKAEHLRSALATSLSKNAKIEKL